MCTAQWIADNSLMSFMGTSGHKQIQLVVSIVETCELCGAAVQTRDVKSCHGADESDHTGVSLLWRRLMGKVTFSVSSPSHGFSSVVK